MTNPIQKNRDRYLAATEGEWEFDFFNPDGAVKIFTREGNKGTEIDFSNSANAALTVAMRKQYLPLLDAHEASEELERATRNTALAADQLLGIYRGETVSPDTAARAEELYFAASNSERAAREAYLTALSAVQAAMEE